MNISSIKNDLYLKKYNILKKGSLKYYHQLLNNQNLTPDELQKFQQRQAEKLIRFAAKKSSFYQKKYSGLNIEDLLEEGTFEHFPIVTRKEVQDDFSTITTENVKYCNRITTGGSTGHPLTVYHPKNICRAAALWRMFSWWNILPGDTRGAVYRETAETLKDKSKAFFVEWPSTHVTLSALNINNESIHSWIKSCNHVKPKIIHGYVGAIELVADYILHNNIHIYKPTAIWVTSAPLTSIAKLKIEKAFATKVYDQYGSCESFYIAAENPYGDGLSVFSDIKMIEIVDENGTPLPPGEEGKILLTDFENYSFPLIRYDTGDIGKWLPNVMKDKLPFPRMAPVKGRQTDYIELPNGTRVSGEYWTTIFDKYPTTVEKFQITQHKDLSISVVYIRNKTDAQSLYKIQKVKELVNEITGESVTLHFREVEDIPLIKGKPKLVKRET